MRLTVSGCAHANSRSTRNDPAVAGPSRPFGAVRRAAWRISSRLQSHPQASRPHCVTGVAQAPVACPTSCSPGDGHVRCSDGYDPLVARSQKSYLSTEFTGRSSEPEGEKTIGPPPGRLQRPRREPDRPLPPSSSGAATYPWHLLPLPPREVPERVTCGHEALGPVLRRSRSQPVAVPTRPEALAAGHGLKMPTNPDLEGWAVEDSNL